MTVTVTAVCPPEHTYFLHFFPWLFLTFPSIACTLRSIRCRYHSSHKCISTVFMHVRSKRAGHKGQPSNSSGWDNDHKPGFFSRQSFYLSYEDGDGTSLHPSLFPEECEFIFLNFSYNIFWSYSLPTPSSPKVLPTTKLHALSLKKKINKTTTTTKVWCPFVSANYSWPWGMRPALEWSWYN